MQKERIQIYVTEHERTGDKVRWNFNKQDPVSIARMLHLFPSRTQKLSSSAPMVLGGQLPGRVGPCRLKKYTLTGVYFFYCIISDPVKRVLLDFLGPKGYSYSCI